MPSVSQAGDRPRPITLPEWNELYHERPRSDAVIADDSTGAAQLAHAMLGDAERRVGRDTGPFWAVDGANQEVSRAFADERLWPTRPGHAAVFSGDFLRRWLADRQKRLGGQKNEATDSPYRSGAGSPLGTVT